LDSALIFAALTGRRRLFDLLCYYKLYTVVRAFPLLFGITSFGTKLRRLKAAERYLASVIDEVHDAWDSRFDESNRLPHVFGPNVTGSSWSLRCGYRPYAGSVDTVPVYVQRHRGQWARVTYSGKYKSCVVKVDLSLSSLRFCMRLVVSPAIFRGARCSYR
jgi:hypothetical protein